MSHPRPAIRGIILALGVLALASCAAEGGAGYGEFYAGPDYDYGGPVFGPSPYYFAGPAWGHGWHRGHGWDRGGGHPWNHAGRHHWGGPGGFRGRGVPGGHFAGPRGHFAARGGGARH